MQQRVVGQKFPETGRSPDWPSPPASGKVVCGQNPSLPPPLSKQHPTGSGAPPGEAVPVTQLSAAPPRSLQASTDEGLW